MAKLAQLLLIKKGERTQLTYFFVVFLLMGAGMAIGRGTADALFFKRYGIEYLPAMYALLSVVFAVTSMAYAAYADRLPAERFFQIIMGMLITLLTGSWALMTLTAQPSAYPLYFLVYEVASELLLLHAAVYLSQNFETLQAKRLTPLIFAAIQVGTIIGGLFLASSVQLLGVQNILLIWVALLLLSITLIRWRHRRLGVSPYYQPGRKGRGGFQQSVEQITQGLRFAKKSELLRAASFALFFMVIAFYVLCYSVNRIYTAHFPTEEALGTFFGLLSAATSSIALVIQILFTNRLLRRFGVRKTNLIFPMGGLISYLGLLASFTFPAALLGSVAKDIVMPAIRRPVRNLFFNALPDYMQGRARALAVALVLPLALALASGILMLTQRLDEPIYFLAAGVIASIGYLYYCLRMNRAYMSAMLATIKEKLFIPDPRREAALKGGDHEIIAELARGIRHRNNEIALAHAKLLAKGYPDRAAGAILPQLESTDIIRRERLLKVLTPLN